MSDDTLPARSLGFEHERNTHWPISLRMDYLRANHADFAKMMDDNMMKMQHATGREITRESPITLREVTATNVRHLCCLDVTEPQRALVAPNAVSIAQAAYSPYAWLRGVYADEAPVGLVLLYDPSLAPATPDMAAEPDELYVWRFMIDASFQSQGFGRQAFAGIIEHAKSRPAVSRVTLSFVPSDGNAEPFYASFGFARTGEVDDGEIVMTMRW
jgi:diamine N-acetyltransferase